MLRLLAVSACLIACACAPRQSTQVDVVVDAEEGIRRDTASLEVVVTGMRDGVGSTPQRFPLDPHFPVTTAIVPRDGDLGRVFAFEVIARDASGEFLVGATLGSGFNPGAHARLSILLEDVCRGVECPDMESCRAGRCVRVPPPDADAGMSDAGVVDAAALDAGAPRDAFMSPCAMCDDGLSCNGVESCDGARCTPGATVLCAPRACETARCVEPAGNCVATPNDVDRDGFGTTACGGTDCNDAAGTVHPGATELCNGVDDDCDRRVDEAATCPSGEVCATRMGVTRCYAPVCGDGVVEGVELCDHGGTPSAPDGCGADCRYDDSCAVPIDLDVVGVRTTGRISYRFSTVGATHVGRGSCFSSLMGPDRIFRMTAPASTMRITVTGNNTDLVVFAGVGCAGAELGCDRDAGGVQPIVLLSGLSVGDPMTLLVDQLVADWAGSHDIVITYP